MPLKWRVSVARVSTSYTRPVCNVRCCCLFARFVQDLWKRNILRCGGQWAYCISLMNHSRIVFSRKNASATFLFNFVCQFAPIVRWTLSWSFPKFLLLVYIIRIFFFFINLLHSYIAFHCELKANNTAQRYTHKQIKRGLNNVGGWIYNF